MHTAAGAARRSSPICERILSMGLDAVKIAACLLPFVGFFVSGTQIRAARTTASRAALLVPGGCPEVRATQEAPFGAHDMMLTVLHVRSGASSTRVHPHHSSAGDREVGCGARGCDAVALTVCVSPVSSHA